MQMEMEVKRDYGNGERSTKYNDRHRTWGWDAAASDVDAIETDAGLSGGSTWAEYSNHTGRRRTYAVMEIKAAPYEHINADYGKRQMEILVDMVRPDLPIFGVEWRTYLEQDDATGDLREDWYFAVYAANDAASVHVGGMDACCMNEKAYVELLYRLRGMNAPADIIEELPDLSVPKLLFVDAKNGVAQPRTFAGW